MPVKWGFLGGLMTFWLWWVSFADGGRKPGFIGFVLGQRIGGREAAPLALALAAEAGGCRSVLRRIGSSQTWHRVR